MRRKLGLIRASVVVLALHYIFRGLDTYRSLPLTCRGAQIQVSTMSAPQPYFCWTGRDLILNIKRSPPEPDEPSNPGQAKNAEGAHETQIDQDLDDSSRSSTITLPEHSTFDLEKLQTLLQTSYDCREAILSSLPLAELADLLHIMHIPLSESEKSLFLSPARMITDNLDMMKQLRRKELGMTLFGKDTREVLELLSWPSAYVKKHGLDEGDAGEKKLKFYSIVCHPRENPSARCHCVHSISKHCRSRQARAKVEYQMPTKLSKWVSAFWKLDIDERLPRSLWRSSGGRTVATIQLVNCALVFTPGIDNGSRFDSLTFMHLHGVPLKIQKANARDCVRYNSDERIPHSAPVSGADASSQVFWGSTTLGYLHLL